MASVCKNRDNNKSQPGSCGCKSLMICMTECTVAISLDVDEMREKLTIPTHLDSILSQDTESLLTR